MLAHILCFLQFHKCQVHISIKENLKEEKITSSLQEIILIIRNYTYNINLFKTPITTHSVGKNFQ